MQIRSIYRLFLAFVLTFAVSTSFAASINWQSYSSSAFATAKKEHRKVLLFGKASWCPWCRRMMSNTFPDSTVANIINKSYVPIMIDIDNNTTVADEYDIKVVPTMIILTADKKIVDSSTGYKDASEMAQFLRR